MSRLATALGFARHLLRRIPAVVREGRLPARPGDLATKLRVAFRDFSLRAGAPPLHPRRLPRPAPKPAGRRRALFITHNLNLEGAPIFLLLLARGLLHARGYEISLVSPFEGPLHARYVAEGIPVGLGDALVGLRQPAGYQRRMTALAAWVREGRFDLVFCNTLGSFWGVTVARLAGVPAVWAIHESVDWRRHFDYLPGFLRPVALDCLAGADRLVFASDATRRLFAELDEPAGRLRTIHYGLDLDAIDRFTRERSKAELRVIHGLRPEERVVSVIGTTCERKGQLDFLRMVRTLARAGTAGIRYYVVGARPGDYLNRLERFVREERLDSVVLVKETPEVFDYFRLSDVFVCSSYEESFPIVVLEAMAFALPIVSTDVFGIPEAVGHDREAVLVPAGDVDGLAAGVARLLAAPRDAARLAASARARLEREFTLERMAEAYDRLFTECLPR